MTEPEKPDTVVSLSGNPILLTLRSGTDALLERFGKRGLRDIVDAACPNVARKRFCLF
jgi:hypothetical protein